MSQARPLPNLFDQKREAARAAQARKVQAERDGADRLQAWLGRDALARSDFRDQPCVTVALNRVREALLHCRDELGYRMLLDLTAYDSLRLEGEHPERFAVVWILVDPEAELRLRLEAWVPEDAPVAPTASDLWPAADWAEREVYDMYGIEFEGHPNLIRLLLPEEYSGHPLRKDYPLRGRGERDNFPVIRRGQA